MVEGEGTPLSTLWKWSLKIHEPCLATGVVHSPRRTLLAAAGAWLGLQGDSASRLTYQPSHSRSLHHMPPSAENPWRNHGNTVLLKQGL